MENKEKYQILYQSLVDGNKEYVDFITTVIGIFLIAIGWLVANHDPFPVLANKILLNTSLVSIVLGTIAISWVSVFHLFRSNKRCKLLRDLNVTEESIFEHYRITLKMICPVLFIHNGLFLAVFILVVNRYG